MLDYAWTALRGAGYAPYYLYRQKYMSGSFENVGWTRPGFENLYNICMMEELHTVLALAPENVTVHTLALKKGSRLMEGETPLPPGEDVAAMLDYAWAALWESGQIPYYLYRQKYMSGSFENVGWCLPGTESLYNICMMEELHTIVSLGGGGVTKLVDRHTGYIQRVANAKYPQEYIQKIDAICADKARVAEFCRQHG